MNYGSAIISTKPQNFKDKTSYLLTNLKIFIPEFKKQTENALKN